MWGVPIDGAIRWLSEPAWQAEAPAPSENVLPVLDTCAVLETGIRVRQRLFVHPERDLLVVQLDIENAPPIGHVYWYANFSPCTRLVPEWPVADWLLDGRNDFACFSTEDGQAIVHFRPARPGVGEWQAARSNVEGRGKGWGAFRDGVYIAYASLEPVENLQCGVENTDSSAYVQARRGLLDGNRAAVGACDSALAITPRQEGGVQRATVLVACAESLDDVMDTLAFGRDQGPSALLDATKTYWSDWLASTPKAANPEFTRVKERCLLAIAQAMDRRTGAIVDAPAKASISAIDMPRNGAWATLALERAGKHELATRHIQFYASALRRSPAPGRPAGTLPAGLYANGVEGLPSAILDMEGAAWMLWLFQSHGECLEQEKQTEFLRGMWEAVDLAAECIVAWDEPRTGEPPPSFDPRLLRDSSRPDRFFALRMGLDSAVRIASLLGEERPGWTQRRDELDMLIQRDFISSDEKWPTSASAMLWPAALYPPDDPRWWDAIVSRMKNLHAYGPVERLERLCDALFMSQNESEQYVSLPQFILNEVARYPSRAPLSTHEAALLYLLLDKGFSPHPPAP